MKEIALHPRLSKGRQHILACLVALGLAGCSAPADLAGMASTAGRTTQRFDQFQAAADNGRMLVVVGGNGIVVASADRGAHWARQEIGGDAALVGIAACPDGSFAALDFFHRLWLADASAGGWQARELKDPINPLAIACDSANRLWVAGSGATIAMSADRGATWKPTVLGDDLLLTSIQFVDGQHAYITGEFGAVFRSTDGGATWTARTRIGADFYPYAACFTDAERGWVSGLAGVVMHTADGGQTWQKQANPLGAPIYGLAVDQGQAIGVGVNGLLFRLKDGQWTFSGARPTSYLRAVLPLPDGRVLLAGGSGALEIANLASGAAAAAN